MLARLSSLIAAVAVLLLAAAPDALAQACTGRPGASAIEQYCEAIPEATGNRVTPKQNREQGSSGADVPSGTSQQLEDAGADGAAVIGLVAGSAGGSDDDDASGGSSSGTTKKTQPPATEQQDDDDVTAASSPSDNPLKAVSSAVSNGATVGSGFLWGLLLLAFAAAGAVWFGFRRQSPPEQ